MPVHEPRTQFYGGLFLIPSRYFSRSADSKLWVNYWVYFMKQKFQKWSGSILSKHTDKYNEGIWLLKLTIYSLTNPFPCTTFYCNLILIFCISQHQVKIDNNHKITTYSNVYDIMSLLQHFLYLTHLTIFF